MSRKEAGYINADCAAGTISACQTGADHTFFDRTFCRMCLARLRSATSCFSCPFSSSSCFRRLSSPTPRPPYTFFQRVERLLRNPHPPDNFGHRRAGSRLLQREGNLLICVPRSLHSSSLPEGFSRPENSRSNWTKNRGGVNKADKSVAAAYQWLKREALAKSPGGDHSDESGLAYAGASLQGLVSCGGLSR